MTKPRKLGPPFRLNSDQQLEVLRLHRDERVKIAAIAEVYNVASTTVWRVLRRFGAVDRPMATALERRVILRMSKERCTREQIATFLGRSKSFVFWWQRKLGCRLKDHRPTERQKNQICQLYQSGLGQVAVVKKTTFPQPTILRVLAERGIPHHRTARPPALTSEKRRQAIRMIRAKRHYLKEIAAKLGVHRGCIEELAHQILGCERFFGGAIWPPLQSAFPEKQRHDGCTIGDCMNLLSRIFPDGLPPSPDSIIVPVIVDLLQETFPFWRTASTPVLLNLESHLVAALGTMRSVEGALVN